MSCRIADKYDMNGFFIVIEISGLQQFLSVNEPAASDLIKNCGRSINNTIKAELNISGSLMIFAIESGMENAASVTETSVNLLEILNGYTEEIHEFSIMLLYRKNTDKDKFETEMKQKFFTQNVDYSILIENRIAEAVNISADEDVPGFQCIKLEGPVEIAGAGKNIEKLIKQSEVDRIVNMLVPLFENSYEPCRIILSGDSELVLRTNLERAIETVSGKNKNMSVVNINFLEKETDVISPFVRSIDPRLIPTVEDSLHGVELKTWQTVKHRLENINSDYPKEYFLSAYGLYLKAVMKANMELLLPRIIIITGINSKSDDFLKFTERVTKIFEEECHPVLFLIDTSKSEDKYNYSDNEYLHSAIKTDCCQRIASPDSVKKLSYLNTRLLFTLKTVEGLFSKHLLEDFLTGLGYSIIEVVAGLKELEDNGCIIEGRYIHLMENIGLDEAAAKINEKIDIFKSLADFINANIYNKEFTDYGRAAVQLAEYAGEELVGSAIFNCLTMMLNYGQTGFVKDYLEEYGSALTEKIFKALALRASLIDNIEAVTEKNESPETLNDALLLMEVARSYHASCDYQLALDYIKKVLIFLQAGDYPALEGAAFIELGFLMMCKGKLLESSEYLNLSIEKLTNSGDSFNLMKALLFSGVQQYLWGSLDSSEDFVDRAAEIAAEKGFEEWNMYILFFKCRLFFELGRYYDAEKILSECLLQNEIYRNDSRRKIFSAWTARACIYQGKIYRGINMLLSLDEDPEVLFFLAEAYYFNGNMEKAVSSIEKAESTDAYFDLGFLALEHISWKNGFHSVEGRVLRSGRGTGVLLHNIRAFHAFLLGLTGNREYGSEILFSLTRDEKISDNDPFNRLYFYFYCQLLERRADTEMVDKLTLISKALKYLQQTSSRINNPKIRQQYMKSNYWNSKLVNEAQREKLI